MAAEGEVRPLARRLTHCTILSLQSLILHLPIGSRLHPESLHLLQPLLVLMDGFHQFVSDLILQ